MFLQLGTGPDGAGVDRFRGEAKDAEYRNQIEINDWKWNLIPPSDSSSMAGTGANASQSVNAAEPSILSFSKTMCRASSAMLKAMMTGEFLHAVISLEEDSDVDFLLTLTLTEVRICGYELDISGPEVKEKWDLDYKDIKFLYRRNYADVNGDLLVERQARIQRVQDPVSRGKHVGRRTQAPREEAGGDVDEGEFRAHQGREALAEQGHRIVMRLPVHASTRLPRWQYREARLPGGEPSGRLLRAAS
jgi:type VI protein secretion system component Hcp